MKMEQTASFETFEFKLQTAVNHPEESVQLSEHDEIWNQQTFSCLFKFDASTAETS
jgi:hypothetical protein